jgi:hypothetical protein
VPKSNRVGLGCSSPFNGCSFLALTKDTETEGPWYGDTPGSSRAFPMTHFLFAFLDLTEFRTPFTGIRDLRVAVGDAWYLPFAGRMNRRAAEHCGPTSGNYKKMLRISCHGPSLPC